MRTNQKRKRKRTTVGSILVPELPWLRKDCEFCPTCHRRDHPGQTCAELEAYCATPGHDQYPCDCGSPFTCV